MKDNTLAIGDKVVLNFGGLEMTVKTIITNGDKVVIACSWEPNLDSAVFPVECVHKV